MKTEKIYIELLLLKAQNGEVNAFEDLLHHMQFRMLNYGRRILGNPNDAEDCVQDALLVVIKKINQLKDVRAFHAWYYKIMHSRCMDHLRKFKADRVSLENDQAKMELSKTDDTELTDTSLEIRKAMKRLKPVHQSVIYFFYFEGFSVKEISDIMNKPAGTIKSLLFDGRQAIKTFLNQE